MNELDNIAEQLKTIKEKRGVSFEHMAREIKVSTQTVLRIVNGKTASPNELTQAAFVSWIEKNRKYL